MTTPRRQHVDIPDASRYSRREFLASTGATGPAIIAPAFVPLKVSAAPAIAEARALPAPTKEGGMPLMQALNLRQKQIEKARVVLSGAAPVPWRSIAVEEAIAGEELNAEIVSKATEAVVKNAEPLKHNGYMLALFRGIVEEELLAISQS